MLRDVNVETESPRQAGLEGIVPCGCLQSKPVNLYPVLSTVDAGKVILLIPPAACLQIVHLPLFLGRDSFINGDFFSSFLKALSSVSL